MNKALSTVVRMGIGAVVSGLVAAALLGATSMMNLRPYGASGQLGTFTVAAQFACVAGLLLSGWLWRRGRRLVGHGGALVSLSAFSVATLGLPLAATKLYLFGLSVDQQFRTEYLTRLTDTAALHDMTYAGLPASYPPGWFWIGGRAAALTETPAWEMFKPWAITSITIAITVAFVLWTTMIRFDHALIVSAATAAVTLAYAPAEPYAAVLVVLVPPALVLAWSGLRGASRSGGWAAVVGGGLFLGGAALCYTLLFGYCAFTLTVMAMAAAVASRKGRWWDPLLRLAAIAVIAGAVALLGWLPYLEALAHGAPSGARAAFHYLPDDGAQLPFPMLQFTLLGGLCMIGTIWLLLRARTSPLAGALALGVVAVYAWSVLSMLATLTRTTLLSFRLQPTLTALLAAAGTFGFVEATHTLAQRYRPRSARWIATAAGVIGIVGALGFSQDIPNVLKSDLVVAYSDTDGNGQRADHRTPGAERYYRDIDAWILQTTGRPRDQTIVLTTDFSFLSYYPYWGFQSLTPHYANPLAQFDKRALAIKSWSQLSTPGPFIAALDTLPWPAPTVFLMRRGAHGTYTLRLASDVYPNQPNVRRYEVTFDETLFNDSRFSLTTIGPFMIAIRTRH